MKSQVRSMQMEDLDDVYAIEIVAHVTPWSRDILHDCIFVGYDCRVFELIDDTHHAIAGYIVSRYADHQLHVLNLCIATGHQHKGYGQLLLQTIIDTPTMPDIREVILEARPSNTKALGLYQKMGFQQIGIKTAYYCDEQGVEDGIVLQKILMPHQP